MGVNFCGQCSEKDMTSKAKRREGFNSRVISVPFKPSSSSRGFQLEIERRKTRVSRIGRSERERTFCHAGERRQPISSDWAKSHSLDSGMHRNDGIACWQRAGSVQIVA
jgi:hypothetical protein